MINLKMRRYLRAAQAAAGAGRWRLRHLNPDRHPLAATIVIGAVAAAAGVLVLVVLVVALAQAPARIEHAYVVYQDQVGEQFFQACEQARRPDCQQFWPAAP